MSFATRVSNEGLTEVGLEAIKRWKRTCRADNTQMQLAYEMDEDDK